VVTASIRQLSDNEEEAAEPMHYDFLTAETVPD
jgi:hypothetical protein